MKFESPVEKESVRMLQPTQKDTLASFMLEQGHITDKTAIIADYARVLYVVTDRVVITASSNSDEQ